MIYYKIFVNVYGGEQRLTALCNANTNFINWSLEFWNWESSRVDSSSLWQIAFHPINQWNVGFVMVNKATGKLAVAKKINASDWQYVIQKDIPSDGVIPNEYVWQTNVTSVAAFDGKKGRTIMPLLNKDKCLALRSTGDELLPILTDWEGEVQRVPSLWQIEPIWS